MNASLAFLLISMSVAVLAGCGERDQSLPATQNTSDAQPWQGAHNVFVVKGWTPGDKTSWEKQIHTRNQTQNEYAKVN